MLREKGKPMLVVNNYKYNFHKVLSGNLCRWRRFGLSTEYNQEVDVANLQNTFNNLKICVCGLSFLDPPRLILALPDELFDVN